MQPPFQSFLLRLFVVLAFSGIITHLHAQEPAIVLREDLEQNPALKAEYDLCIAGGASRCPVSRIYLQTSASSIALAANGTIYGVVVLPHFISGKTQRFNVPVRLVTPTDQNPGRLKRPYLAVDVSEELYDALVEYLGDLQPGTRYEPVLEIKNLIVGGIEQTSVSVVPVGLTLAYDADSSVLLNGELAMRAIYVPSWMAGDISQKAYWSLRQPSAVSTAAVAICGVTFSNAYASRGLNSITLGIQGLALEGEGTITFSPPPPATFGRKSLPGRAPAAPAPNPSPQPASARSNEQSKSSSLDLTTRATPSDQQIFSRSVPFTRPGRNVRPQTFRFGAPVVVTDYPIYLRAEYTSSNESSDGRSNIVGIDLNLNFNGSKTDPGPLKPIVIAGNPNLTLSPALKLKMNNILNVDNENSFRWWAPIAYTIPFTPTCLASPPCTSGTCCQKPFLRSINLIAGLNGEHAAYNQNQNIVVPLGMDFRFRTFNATPRKDYNIVLDIFAGAQVGRTIDKTTVAYVSTADDSRKILIRPATATNIRRLHGQVKFNVGLGKNRSFNLTWDRWQLLEEEQYLRARDVRGSFNAARPDFLPADIPWEPFNQKLTLFLPEFRKGFRHYWSAKFVWEVTQYVSFDASYFRGELPPSFQYVDKFTIGIAFQKK